MSTFDSRSSLEYRGNIIFINGGSFIVKHAGEDFVFTDVKDAQQWIDRIVEERDHCWNPYGGNS